RLGSPGIARHGIAALAVVKKILRIELLMALVPGGAAVKFRSAMLGDHVHLRSTLQTVFCSVGVRLDIDFRDCVDAGDAAEITSAAAIAAVHTVCVHRIPTSALEYRHGGLVAATPCVLIRDELHAGESLEHRHRIAAFHNDQLHLFAVDGGR